MDINEAMSQLKDQGIEAPTYDQIQAHINGGGNPSGGDPNEKGAPPANVKTDEPEFTGKDFDINEYLKNNPEKVTNFGNENNEEEEEEGGKNELSNQKPNQKPNENNENLNVTDLIAEDLKKYLPEGQELPEEITRENYLQVALQTLGPRLIENAVSPEALKYDEFLRNGGKPEEYMKAGEAFTNTLSLPKDDLITKFYMDQYGKSENRPEGLEEDVIKSKIQEMDDFQKIKEYEQAKTHYSNLQQQAKYAKLSEAAQAKKNSLDERRTKNLREIDEVITSSKDLSEIYGLKVDPQDLASWNVEFRELMTLDEEGNLPAAKVLANNKELYKMLYFATRKDGVASYLNDAQKTRLKELKDKLDITPRKRSSRSAGAPQIDMDALVRPDN